MKKSKLPRKPVMINTPQHSNDISPMVLRYQQHVKKVIIAIALIVIVIIVIMILLIC